MLKTIFQVPETDSEQKITEPKWSTQVEERTASYYIETIEGFSGAWLRSHTSLTTKNSGLSLNQLEPRR